LTDATHTGGRYALIVAVSAYDDPKLGKLRAPAADAERLATVLNNPDIGAFNVEVALNEEEPQLTRRIAAFFSNRRTDDLLLVHFSCHGVKDEGGELYLAAKDTRIGLLEATAISSTWLNKLLNSSRSKRIMLLLDCCYSGSFPLGKRPRAGEEVNPNQQLEGRGRALITASSAMEYSYEGDQLSGKGQPSVFTKAVAEGLETGEADRDGDKRISVDELYDYVYDRVKQETPSQNPNKLSSLEGPLYIARSVYEPPVEPAELDQQLLDATEHPFAGVRLGAVESLSELLSSTNPGMCLSARLTLERMINDDSHKVSERAEAVLREHEASPESATPAPDGTSNDEGIPGSGRAPEPDREPQRERVGSSELASPDEGPSAAQNDRLFRRMVDALTGYAVIMLDKSGIVLSWNAGANQILGYETREIIGQNFSRFYGEEAAADGYPEQRLETAATFGGYEGTDWFVRKDRDRTATFWAHIAIVPVYDDVGSDANTRFALVVSDITAEKQSKDRLRNDLELCRRNAKRDRLTGLLNRDAWDEALERETSRAQRHGSPLCVCMLGLDNFKQINDEHGHESGDAVLKQTSRSWPQALRATDILARYGGDEFGLVLPDCNFENAQLVVERLRQSMSTPRSVLSPLTCSAGVAEWDRQESEEALVKRAYDALRGDRAHA
jgi:diguanylate cyclase (GGDEF)-like protein/PAS domain S-box-containing protein